MWKAIKQHPYQKVHLLAPAVTLLSLFFLQCLTLKIRTVEDFKSFAKTLYTSAVCGPMYAPLYAKLCYRISQVNRIVLSLVLCNYILKCKWLITKITLLKRLLSKSPEYASIVVKFNDLKVEDIFNEKVKGFMLICLLQSRVEIILLKKLCNVDQTLWFVIASFVCCLVAIQKII